ncbi:MAG: LysE family transporter [Chlorobi bacterium]|nr:LysE family transporter [Chlorobiota bacterium]
MWAELLKHFFAGFIVTFFAVAPPGIISLTGLKVAVEKGKKAGIKYALGVMIPDIIQAHIAILGAEYIMQHPKLLEWLGRAAVFILLLLAWTTYRQAKKGIRESTFLKLNIRNPFYYGLLISAVNPMAIPFYFVYSSMLHYWGIIRLDQPYASVYIAGAVLGAFTLLSIYSIYARKIIGRITFIAKNFYYILSGLFLLLAVIAFISLYV